MLIDVRNIDGRSVDFSFDENVDINLPSGMTDAKVSIRGNVRRRDNSLYIVKGSIDAVLNPQCDRCLKPFELSISAELDELYGEEPDEDGEIWLVTDKTIDIKPAVIADIMLALPMRLLCSEDCRGLCPRCGHDLNEGDCGCDRGYINPQFEKLLNMFEDEQ